MKQGDLVVRKSYGGDVLFRVATINQESAVLKGTDYRLLADAPIPDLSVVRDPEITGAAKQVRIKVNESLQRVQEQRDKQVLHNESPIRRAMNESQPYFEVPGKVLHLDGDGSYMKKSMQLYTQMRVPAHGLHVHESQMTDAVYRLLPQIKPDIIVITGHDGVLKARNRNDLQSLSSYKNSQNFVNAVHVAREYEKDKDGLIIVAGACQSHYEALLQSGANFASSPGRVLIHALDPVYVAIKASYTSIRETINLADVIHGTISGIDGVGGIETLGMYRVGLPKPKTLTDVKSTV
ncbi:sporulation-specific protease YabG [Paenibacillus baekrokdamisoli]|uniref:Sporulation-specific protease YabG n=1 Tax=Paenibacillus baekrokdamisoli TaxID=1712516 RepID=A0A3G9IXW0_9BACL|nr:sporulation peptidase YabG [Paenibacillus baekrokdamisoli]MBB3072974.1 spore coat assembly protein [Paenibacillus baekrokdamisoli]BBH23356.1 sporulation-specific protease YabG [Paenibacillus baekrokdamisoli]